jgi:hypothetical protein
VVNNDFCVDIDFVVEAGLHISLDGKDVTLREKKFQSLMITRARRRRAFARGWGLDKASLLSVLSWNNAPNTGSK